MRRRWRRILPLVAMATALLVLAGCGVDYWAPDAASEEGEHIRRLYIGTWTAAFAVGAIVWASLLFVMLRYRRRPSDSGEPSQRSFNVALEIALAVIPVLIVVTLWGFNIATQREVTELSSDPDVRVQVIGYQWSWEFRYEGTPVRVIGTGEGTAGPELVLPVDQVTRLRLTPTDVVHSFYVPRFLSKRDLIPGIRNRIDVQPTEEGTFAGKCAEYCGLDHWRMNFRVRVVSAEEFDRWLEDRAAEAPGTTVPPTTAQAGP